MCVCTRERACVRVSVCVFVVLVLRLCLCMCVGACACVCVRHLNPSSHGTLPKISVLVSCVKLISVAHYGAPLRHRPGPGHCVVVLTVVFLVLQALSVETRFVCV